jgi:hypothetical protein
LIEKYNELLLLEESNAKQKTEEAWRNLSWRVCSIRKNL